MADQTSYGALYIVATPIGNLEDITYRAVRTLRQVDLVAAEDTRHSKKLFNHYNIETRLISFHEHNEDHKISQLITILKDGKHIALISDAGTPTVSDPGYTLVAAAAEEHIPIIPVPGCSAAVAALSVSGLPTDRFLFIGFPPKKKQKQKALLNTLKTQPATLIFYESPKRISGLIRNMLTIFGDRPACLAREITKIHEEYIRGNLSDILAALERKPSVKGECCFVVHGDTDTASPASDETAKKIIRHRLQNPDKSISGMAKELAGVCNRPKNEMYNLILELKQS
jgi:16S rRNA (cytidine1402-2'-O)-methyltransferase